MALNKHSDTPRPSLLARVRNLTLTRSTTPASKQPEFNQQFVEYCKANNYLEAYTYLNAKPSIAHCAMATANEYEPIDWAAHHGNVDLAELVLTASGIQKDSMLQSRKDRLFQTATGKNHTEFMKWLIEKTPDPTERENMLHVNHNKPLKSALKNCSSSAILLICQATPSSPQPFSQLMTLIQDEISRANNFRGTDIAMWGIDFLLTNIDDANLLQSWCHSTTAHHNPLLADYLSTASPFCMSNLALQSRGYHPKKVNAMEKLLNLPLDELDDLASSPTKPVSLNELLLVCSIKNAYKDDIALRPLMAADSPEQVPNTTTAITLKARVSFREKLAAEVEAFAAPSLG